MIIAYKDQQERIMIPLDQHFNALLNDTVPFVLPKASKPTPPKVVPTATTAAAPRASKRPELGLFSAEPDLSALTACTLDCHCDTASEFITTSQTAAQTAAPVKEAIRSEPSHSKVEIAARPSVPFVIDDRMIINRPRLSLKESGLPVSLNPAEPDPSIVGESVLGLKLTPSDESSARTSSQESKIRGEISDEMICLLEQQPVQTPKPSLKAFHPVDDTPQDILDAWMYENSCEIDDGVEEEEWEKAVSIEESVEEQGLTEEELLLAEEAARFDACELADEVTEDDLAYETQTYETQATEPAFCPMLQVDRFAWPDFCQNMHPIIQTQLDHLGDQLIAKSVSGKKVVAVVGSSPRAGSTSILLGLATSLEAAGQRVAIVDANINSPTLANSLGLQPEQGWETVTSGKLPVEESLIDSIEDHIALLPLCLEESEKLTFGVRPSENERMNEAIRLMKEHYDLVLVDLGSPEAADIAAFSNMSEWIDSAVVVHNLRDGSRGQLIQTKNLMRDYGIPVAGIAENFAPREACFDDRYDYRAA